ncbi:MAG TPA: hemerythrin domain-containing protein [Micromonosporaceae bacterium]|nr:hemerythrin domain-containing protein [Micromonosporaceae bacterium]
MADDPTDAIDLLLEQHAQIEDLFRDVLTFTGEDKQEAFEDLVRLLSVHETAEEQIIHPLARTSGETDMVDARLEEEREAKELLKTLYDDGTKAPGFDTRLLELRLAVLAHAKHEERYEFPQLRRLHSGARLKAAAVAIRAAEAVAPTRPHPGVESATKNVLLGGPTALVDRIRDTLQNRGSD